MSTDDIRKSVEAYQNINFSLARAVNGIDLYYSVVNTNTLWRAETIQSKEPETYDWILSLSPNDILFDVGANIGLYTCLAAKVIGTRVYAFEPESQNYALLNRNIVLNGLSGRATAYCAAVTDRFRLDELFLTRFDYGGSCHQFGEKVTYNLEPVQTMLAQGCVGVALDELVQGGLLPVPTHIKIDVDGFEHKVLAGARTILDNPALRSILVEINVHLPQHVAMFELLKGCGFSFSQSQMDESSCGEHSGDSRFSKLFNVIFRRA